jgi:hypothetical protein
MTITKNGAEKANLSERQGRKVTGLTTVAVASRQDMIAGLPQLEMIF